MVTYFQALILGLLQGITELFPISSLGHSVLIANLFDWHNVLSGETNKASSFLLFVVVIHVATALALLVFYRHIWAKIVSGLFRSLKTRKIDTPDAKLAWLLIAATIPAGIIGLVLQNVLQKQFAKPLSAIVFIMLNGCILLIADRRRKQIAAQRRNRRQSNLPASPNSVARTASSTLTLRRAGAIGVAQVAALFAGISRSGITITSGIYSGLDYESSARFSFLLATPIILAAGLYKLPAVIGHKSAGMHGQMVLGAVCAAITAYLSVRFLDRYFKDRTLQPFAIYCIVFGGGLLILGLIRGHF